MWCDMIWSDVILRDVLWSDVMLCYVMWCNVTWCYVKWSDVMWCNVMWHDIMWCDMKWCDVMWYAVIWYEVMWCYVMLCDVMWHDVMWCDVIWSDVKLCYVMLCYVMWCDVMWCNVMWSTDNSFTLRQLTESQILTVQFTEQTALCWTSPCLTQNRLLINTKFFIVLYTWLTRTGQNTKLCADWDNQKIKQLGFKPSQSTAMTSIRTKIGPLNFSNFNVSHFIVI